MNFTSETLSATHRIKVQQRICVHSLRAVLISSYSYSFSLRTVLNPRLRPVSLMNELKPTRNILKKIALALTSYEGIPYHFRMVDTRYRRLAAGHDYYRERIALAKASLPPPE